MASPDGARRYEVDAVRYGTLRSRKATCSTGTRATASPTSRSRWRTTSGSCATATRRSSSTAASTRRSEPGVGARACARRVEALRALGVEPESVSTVVVTHLHYDHIGNLSAFPAATLIVPTEGARLLDGTDRLALPVRVARGVARDRVRRAGGRRRSRAADRRNRGDPRRRDGDRGRRTLRRAAGDRRARPDGGVVLASDAVHFYEELELERPFAVMHDLEQMYVAYEVLKGFAEEGAEVVPGHDPDVARRYPQVGRLEPLRRRGSDEGREQGHGTRARERREVHEVAMFTREGGGVRGASHWRS